MKKLNSGIWLSAVILFVCVAATAIAYFSRMNDYLLDDSGAVSLLGEVLEETQAPTQVEESVATVPQETLGAPAPEATGSVITAPVTTDATDAEPGFEAGDSQSVWGTDTQVEIFRISYENGEQVVTVASDDGDKLIAPGTENSYTFKLKNTGNVALDYTVTLDAWFTLEDVSIPIQARLSRYDGEWILGDAESYGDIAALDSAEDSATLGAGKYTYYTLDWVWDFESGDDELDTMLGNLAVQEDLTFTVVIRTVATQSDDPKNDSGITPPKTGDDVNFRLLAVLGLGSFGMIWLLLFLQFGKKRKSKAEDDH